MAPSQLKELKASLRRNGIVAPPKSRKDRERHRKDGTARVDHGRKNAVLQEIRDRFNPFDLRQPAKEKFQVIDRAEALGKKNKSQAVRPGAAKSVGEEVRRNTLLVEMQKRRKIGGMVDRRFGENDPSLAPEDKALQRFVQEQSNRQKKAAVFDLEDSEDEEPGLTHLGQSLSFDFNKVRDDFEEDISGSDQDDTSRDRFHEDGSPSKRRRTSDEMRSMNHDGAASDNTHEGRPRSKKEVMEEVIAKSKLHKYERQQAKEDDDDLRVELDKGLPELHAMLRGIAGTKATKVPAAAGTRMNESERQVDSQGTMDPDRLALLQGKDRAQADKEYDERLRQMVMEQRAQPTMPSLSEEAKARIAAEKAQKLEADRLRRMRGEITESEVDSESEADIEAGNDYEERVESEASLANDDTGGLDHSTQPSELRPLDVEDEDQFVLDNDYSSISESSAGDEIPTDSIESDDSTPEEDDDFTKDMLSIADQGRADLIDAATVEERPKSQSTAMQAKDALKCPETHHDMIALTKDDSLDVLPLKIQRIRALYNTQLAAENKAKLGRFAGLLVEHIAYVADQVEPLRLDILDVLIRHVHSLAKSFPDEVGSAFRKHLLDIFSDRPLKLTRGDLIVLTAIGTIFPTSDQFHVIVNPATLTMARYLSQASYRTLTDFCRGTYISTLLLNYQRLSKRYVPECITFTVNCLYTLTGSKIPDWTCSVPVHASAMSVRLRQAQRNVLPRKLKFSDTFNITPDEREQECLKQTLFVTHLSLIRSMVDMWADKPAFIELVNPFREMLRDIHTEKHGCIQLSKQLRELASGALDHIDRHLEASIKARKPLALHKHRPLAIKTSIPKFEEGYNPDRHYDPSPTRASMSKLKAEHKRERKGAMRELRKDANFIARESLKEKKEKDLAYDKKYKRLVAEIQGEEGREANKYEQEKRLRKASTKR